jgi:hypothetical protein
MSITKQKPKINTKTSQLCITSSSSTSPYYLDATIINSNESCSVFFAKSSLKHSLLHSEGISLYATALCKQYSHITSHHTLKYSFLVQFTESRWQCLSQLISNLRSHTLFKCFQSLDSSANPESPAVFMM